MALYSTNFDNLSELQKEKKKLLAEKEKFHAMSLSDFLFDKSSEARNTKKKSTTKHGVIDAAASSDTTYTGIDWTGIAGSILMPGNILGKAAAAILPVIKYNAFGKVAKKTLLKAGKEVGLGYLKWKALCLAFAITKSLVKSLTDKPAHKQEMPSTIRTKIRK